jgi:hypothetical protein
MMMHYVMIWMCCIISDDMPCTLSRGSRPQRAPPCRDRGSTRRADLGPLRGERQQPAGAGAARRAAVPGPRRAGRQARARPALVRLPQRALARIPIDSRTLGELSPRVCAHVPVGSVTRAASTLTEQYVLQRPHWLLVSCLSSQRDPCLLGSSRVAHDCYA